MKRKRELDRKYHKRKREERLAANIPRKKTEPLSAEEEAEEDTGSDQGRVARRLPAPRQ